MPGATCWLKNQVTPRNEDACCVSGVKGAGVLEKKIGPIEFSIDRTGGDLRNVDVSPDPKGATCEAACKDENRLQRRGFGFGVLLLFVLLEGGFLGAAMMFTELVLHALARKAVFIGNLFAAIAIEEEPVSHRTIAYCSCTCGGEWLGEYTRLKHGHVLLCGCLRDHNREQLQRSLFADAKRK